MINENNVVNKTIQLLYTRLNRKLSDESWCTYMQLMPEEIQQRINRYRRWEDRQARLFGKLLVLEGLKGFGGNCADLNSISIDEFGRLFIDSYIDINISHSEEYVVCTLTNAGRVGVDIERIMTVDISEIDQYMTAEELEDIRRASDSCREFYRYWTIKESISIADGRGLTVDLQEITIHQKQARLQGHNWYLRQIFIDPEYSCHIATDLEDFEFQIKEVEFG